MLPEDINAIVNGLDRGKTAFQGMMPSANQVGGAPAAVDDAAPLLDGLYRQLSKTIDYLHQTRQESDANKLLGALKQISGVQQERRKRFAEAAKTGGGGSAGPAQPNINAMGIV